MRGLAEASNKPLKLEWWVPQHTDSWMSRLHLDLFFFFFFKSPVFSLPLLILFLQARVDRDRDANEQGLGRRWLMPPFELPGSQRRRQRRCNFFFVKDRTFLSVCTVPTRLFVHLSIFTVFIYAPGPCFHPSIATSHLVFVRCDSAPVSCCVP